MNQDRLKVFAPAKLNLFLRIMGRKKDGYHIIRSGITFLNLYDEIEILQSNRTVISYEGCFKPISERYSDCIIKKTLDFLKLDKNINLKINIKKNIPVQSGLGSASSNAAAFVLGLETMGLIAKKEIQNYISLGADVPSCLFKNNCLVLGMGEKIIPQKFPKYYFLLVKPQIDNSTKEMFKKLGFERDSYIENFTKDLKINDNDFGNDFEKIVYKENKEIRDIVSFLDQSNNIIFSRMTGSGSCCYGVFKNQKEANCAQNLFKKNFPKLWSCVCENNMNSQ
tara:strand:- start:637 stop:1479 length:843 start_codon:yes stop_codon:yes gene_type:complete